MGAGDDLVAGPDGLPRCWWVSGSDQLRRYHDVEWGRGPRDEHGLFERISLEALQAGLSWRLILERRETLRGALAGFHPSVLARWTDRDVEAALGAPGVIRNRAKLTAIVHNAQLLDRLHRDGSGLGPVTEEALSAEPLVQPVTPRVRSDVPSLTPASERLSHDLRALGWRFVGPVTAYAYLQAGGWIDDHLVGCVARRS